MIAADLLDIIQTIEDFSERLKNTKMIPKENPL